MAKDRDTSRGWSRFTTWSKSWDVPGRPRPTLKIKPRCAPRLEVAHRRLHERLKPDETAEGRAFALARQKDPAANHNSESIVIHSLHRPGAPGISQAVATPATARSTENPTNAAATGIAPAPEYRK